MPFYGKQADSKKVTKQMVGINSHIFMESPLIMFIVDSKSRLIESNKAAKTFSSDYAQKTEGLAPGNYLGCLNSLQSKKGCGHGKSCKTCILRRTVMDTMATGKSHKKIEATLPINKSKKRVDVEVLLTTKLVKDSTGSSFVLVSLEDVTHFKQSEKVFTERNELLHSMVENLNEGIVIAKNDRYFSAIYMNAFAQKAMELNVKKAVKSGKMPWELFPHLKALNLKKHLTSASKGIISSEKDMPMLLPSGKKAYFSMYFYPLFSNPGEVENIMVVMRDTTLRRQTEETLRAEKDQFSKYINAANAIIVSIDSACKVRLVNKKACEILGYTESEIIGKDWFKNFVPPEIYPVIMKEFNKISSSKANFEDYYENEILCKNGERKLLAWNNTTFHDAQGGFNSVLSHGYDITEHRQAEVKLVEQNLCNKLRAQIWDKISQENPDEKELIRSVMNMVGSGLGMRRAIYFCKDTNKFAPVAEWKSGARVRTMMKTNFPCGLVDGVYNLHKKHSMISVDDLLKTIAKKQAGILAILLKPFLKKFGSNPGFFVPLASGGELEGFFLFSAETRDFWTDEKRALLLDTCKIIFKTMERNSLSLGLNNSREEYRLLFETMADAFAYHRIILDKKGKPYDYEFLKINPSFEKLMGLSREKVIGRTVRQLFPGIEKDPADWINTYGKVALTGREKKFENFAAIQKRWYNVTAYSPAKGYFVAIFEDITEIKKINEAVRSSEKKFRDIFMKNPDSMSINSLPDNRFVSVNEAFSKCTGYSQQEVIGKTSSEIKMWNDAAERKAALELFAKDGYIHDFEHRYMDKAGIIKHGLLSIETIDIDGAPHLLVINKDITAIKQAREEKVKSEEKYRTVADNTYDWEYWEGVDGEYVYISPSVERITGYTREEFLSGKMRMRNLMHPDFVKVWEEHLQEIKRSKSAISVDVMLIRKDGDKIWLNHICRPVFDGNGKPLGRRASNRDITDRKMLELALKNSEKYYRSLIEESSDLVFVIDKDMVIKYVSSSVRNILKMNENEFLGRRFHDTKLKTGAGAEKGYAQIGAMITNPLIPVKNEMELQGRTFEIIGKNLLADPVVNGIVLNLRDVTERKKLEKAIMQSEKYYRAITEESGDIVAVLNPNGVIRYVSPQIFRVTGYTPEELEGKHVFAILPKIIADNIKEGFSAELKNPKSTGDTEFMMKHKDGSRIVLGIKWQNLSEESAIKGVIINARDITEKKKSEEKMKKIIWSLERTNDDLEQFTYVASHDLKEPLRMISNYIELLEIRYAEKFDDDGREFLNYAKGGAKRMYALVQGLLAFSRIGKREKESVPVDLNKVAAEIADDYALNLPAETFEISTLPSVMANAVEMNQLFSNLIGNAVKFSAKNAGPIIKVSSRSIGDAWEICVSDNGIGMDEQYREKVFGLFERLHSDEEYPGTGIGLTICKKIVLSLGGTIWLESAPGKGTKIFFTLPKIEVKEDE